ncbi:hypothetical protein M405DRAFT_345012 [Rhizopogon salebrosus TDB-379]|nr:hypothetical protein M405DRAFT_345012 [Rhizopogon salebrosus TDB-379]
MIVMVSHVRYCLSYDTEPVCVLVDPQVGISTIALPLARRWWREVDVGERMQGVLTTQFEGVFYTVHCDFDVVAQDQRLADDEVEVVAGNNWIQLCRLMSSDSRPVRIVGEWSPFS